MSKANKKRPTKAKQAEPTRLQLMPEYVENDPIFAKKHGYNAFLVSQTQPGGNLSFKDERFIETGDGNVCCIHLYGLPSKVSEFWLRDILNMEGVLTSLDVAPADPEEMRKKLSRSLDEVKSRKFRNDEEYIEAQQRYDLLYDTLEGVISQAEVVKWVHLRIYVSGRNKKELNLTCEKIIDELESAEYQAAVFLDETEMEYTALFTSYTEQAKQLNRRKGIGCPSSAIALGYPFNMERLDDPCGLYLGYSQTDGNIFWDPFHKDEYRLSYDGFVAGKKGSGKSTLLKMLMKMNAMLGNFIRVLDLTGEFTTLAETLGGVVIHMDGSHFCLNLLEIFKCDADDSVNFSRHLSKLNMIYKFLAPESSDDIRNEFEEYCRILYERFGIWNPQGGAEQHPTGRAPEEYPVFSDLLQLIRDDLYEDFETHQENMKLSESKRKRLESIELTIQNLVNAYPQMFNRHTSLPELTNKQIVVFNVQNLSNMKEGIFYAQLFSIMSLFLALLLAQMQQESSGQGLDPMQASEGPYNKNYSHQPNGITDPHYSIECGVQELRDCLKAAGATGPADLAGIKLALQGYNFGNGYIDWAKQRGGYTEANAIEFSNMMAQKEGWSSYGDTQYVQHVLQYYSADGSASGGMTGGDAQKLIEVTNTIKGTTHYVLGGETPGQALDCSSYVCWAYTKAGIKNMPRVTAQGIYDNYCTPISKSQAKAGDIIFFKATYDCGETITHVGIYLGNGKMMHCSSSADAIVEGDCTTSYWTTHFYAFGRVK